MLNDHSDLIGGEDLNVGSERALNDVALSIGFSMMVLLFVVVSSMTALQNIAVTLPEADPAPAKKEPSADTLHVVVSLEARDGRLGAVYADDQSLPLDGALETALEQRYGAPIADAGAVVLQIHADGGLSHADVSGVVFRLNAAFRTLGGASRRMTVRYVARAAD